MADTESDGRELPGRRDTLARVRDAAEAVGTRANAVVNGAVSVFPGVYNAGRALARGVGLLGPDEFRRFGREADVIGGSLEQIVKHPEPAVRAAGKAWSNLWDDPLLPFYLGGRIGMGALTRLGPVAGVGDALRAVEGGHNLVDAVLYPGIQGRPPPSGGLLGIPPEGGGLLGIPRDHR